MRLPKRIQRRRTKGYTLPPNSRSVTRGTKWGNPFKVATQSAGQAPPDDLTFPTRAQAVAAYRKYARQQLAADPTWLDELWNYDYLACYCPPAEPCHVDVLLELMKQRGAPG